MYLPTRDCSSLAEQIGIRFSQLMLQENFTKAVPRPTDRRCCFSGTGNESFGVLLWVSSSVG